jgi:hypothetical protein
MVAGKKECLGCFELINEKAQKCPHCQQIQSKLYTAQYNKWVIVSMFVVLFGFMFYLLNDVRNYTGRKSPSQALVVETAELYARTVAGIDFVSCSGTLSNPGARDADDIDLRADFFDDKEKPIDTLVVRSNLRVNSGTKSSYRVRGEADKPLPEYRSCKVVVVDQWFKR